MFLRCRDVVANLTDFDEGRGGRWRRARMRLHLSLCSRCQRYWRQMNALRATLAALKTDRVSDQTKAQLAERFRAWRSQPKSSQ